MSGRRPKVEYSPRARRDLRSIRRFGETRWGQERSVAYIRRIREVVRKLQNFPNIGKSRSEIASDLRSFPVEEHVIFYRSSSAGMVIVAILHSNSDIDTLLRPMSDQAE